MEAAMNWREHHRSVSMPSGTIPFLGLAVGVMIGAGLMFLFDPKGGNRRRALLRDKAKHYGRVASRQVRKHAHYGLGRAKGMIAEARASLKHEEIDDQQLRERVRSAMGRAVSHPHSIQVDVRDCVVSLSGPILAHEVDDLMHCIWDVRGVADVIDNLDVHEHPGTIPGLQRG
jgi:hypothetical protein